MEIGKVKWFGGYNWQYERENNYGFIQSIEDGNDIYFHKKGICKDSLFYDEDRVDEYVVYETEETGQNRIRAVKVRLLNELNVKEQKQIYIKYKNNDDIQKILRRECPEIFEQQPLDYYLQYLNEHTICNIFLKRCQEMSLEEIQKKLGSNLQNDMVRQILLPNMPELYLSDDMKNYFCEIQNSDKVKKLLLERYNKGYFHTSLSREYGEWIITTEVSLVRNRVTMEQFFDSIDWEIEPLEDIEYLIVQVKDKGGTVGKILRKRKELIILSSEICKKINIIDIEEIRLQDIITSNAKLEFVLQNVNDNVKRYVANCIENELLISSKEALKVVKDERLCKIIEQIKWTEIAEEYQNKYKKLFSFVEADVHEKASTKIAIFMRNQNATLAISWWKLFTDSVKIRILIYCTNFKEERQNWFNELREIYQWEERASNRLLLSVLRFFVNIYHSNSDLEKQKKNFMTAHDELMNYIVESFSEGLDVSNGLNTLLEKCHQGYGNKKYFCDARVWKKQDKIFCPEGYARPQNGRTGCKYIREMDLSNTKYSETKDYKDQYFTDFLINIGCVPDLSELGIKNKWEYAYRISAFVNRIIDMRQHMKCEKCGQRFYPKFEYSMKINAKLSMTRFYCPQSSVEEQNVGHDFNVYLNYCYNCKKVIDSRECINREYKASGQYRCMYCGATEHIKAGTQCPICLNSDTRTLELKGNNRIVCEKCGYDAIDFKSKFENKIEYLSNGEIIPEGLGEALSFY